MSIRTLIFAFALSFAAVLPAFAIEADLSGQVGLESRLFLNDPLYAGQQHSTVSTLAEAELYAPFGAGHAVTVTPYGRLDAADGERSHWDLREAYVQMVFPTVELSIGLKRIYWGVTEVRHLVDNINQIDLVENPDGEDRLGQPMVQLTVPTPNGTVDLFAMPYFRERTFPGTDGRLRAPLTVATDYATYESGDEERHMDLAARYGFFAGPWEVGISHFSGTIRDPQLLPSATCAALGCPPGVLVPYYQQGHLTGLDAQLIIGEWLLKLEALHRSGLVGGTSDAFVTGFEYTFVGVMGSRMDLGVLGEWLYDDVGEGATPFNNDLSAGLRLAVNDIQSSELLAAVTADPNNGAWGMFVEASRRLGASYTVEAEARLSGSAPPEDVLYATRDDDYLQLALTHHF
ncbi:MAG: hypothetical protein ACE5FN_04290 [Leptospirillia bacterium]